LLTRHIEKTFKPLTQANLIVCPLQGPRHSCDSSPYHIALFRTCFAAAAATAVAALSTLSSFEAILHVLHMFDAAQLHTILMVPSEC